MLELQLSKLLRKDVLMSASGAYAVASSPKIRNTHNPQYESSKGCASELDRRLAEVEADVASRGDSVGHRR